MEEYDFASVREDQQEEKQEVQAEQPVGDAKAKVNPKLRAMSVVLDGENLGGDGENGNVFRDGRKYNVKQEALDQKDQNNNYYLVEGGD